LMSLDDIRRLLGSEPWCFLQRDIDDLDRDTIFSCYLTREVMNRGKKKARKPSATHREIFFAHGRLIGDSWLQSEAAWQRRSKSSSSKSPTR
jgi:hypothetical protein